MGSMGRGSRPRRAPRGSVAVMAAVTLPVVLVMFAFALVVGMLRDSHNRLNAAGDAVAATYAEQALVLPQQYWLQTPDVVTLGAANGVPQGLFSVSNVSVYPLAGPGKNHYDAWAPAVLQVDSSYSSPAGGLASFATAFLQSAVPMLEAHNSARLSQLQLGTFTMARERVMFVLDFSKSMRLHYDGQDSNPTGVEVMRETGSKAIQNFAGVFDAGVLLFSDSDLTNNANELALLNSTKNQAQGTSSDQNAHVGQLSSMVNSAGTMGNGTDLAAAITRAQQMLTAASADTSQLYSNQRMIIITDGEPDVGTGISDHEPYGMRVAAAEAAATQAMNAAMQMGTMAQVVFMERTQPDQTILAQAETFLKGLAGNQQQKGNPNNFHTDAKDYGEIIKWLLAQPTYPVCYSEAIDQGSLTPPVPRALLPGAGETLMAYFDMSAAGYPGEQQVATVLYGAAQQQNFLDATKYAGATITTGGSASVDLSLLQNPNNLIVWYDDSPGSHRIWISPMMCAAMNSLQNQSRQMRLRLRWGAPRPVLRGEEAIDVAGYTGI